jgi:4-carboxymuconolactone decarboxylase
MANLAQVDPGLVDIANDFIFTKLWTRPGISFEDRMLVAIVAMACDDKPTQLKNYLHSALQDGMEPMRIHEALVMLTALVGFPTALNALWVWKEVVHSERRRGLEVNCPIAHE